VSGLPGSGKSTLARTLARALGQPHVDKDAILETLFDSLGVGDEPWRHRLSRASDEILYTVAAGTRGAVLDNWWQREWAAGRLPRLGRLVEVHCDCPVEVAASRFRARRRHPGHLDPDLTDVELADRIEVVRSTYQGPLRLGGPVLTVDTHRPVDVAALVSEITGTDITS
jgi:predicted kinase